MDPTRSTFSKSAPAGLAPIRLAPRRRGAPRGAAIRSSSRAQHDAAQNYSVQAGLSDLMRDAMQELLVAKPEHPEHFLRDYFGKRHRLAQGKTPEAGEPAGGVEAPAAALASDYVEESGRRRFFMGGNWKCSGSRESAAVLLKALASRAAEVHAAPLRPSLHRSVGRARHRHDRPLPPPQVPSSVDVVLFPSLLHLQLASQLLPSGAGSPFALGAQNAWEGAVTEGVAGGVGGAMLREMGVEWTMLGHSDRRNKLGESAQLVGDKAAAALQAHPQPPPQPPPPLPTPRS